MKRMLFIYNPHAGQGRVTANLSHIIDAFTYQGYLPAVYPTRAAGDATRVVAGIGKHYRKIVCCGGDGTLHEVVTALMDLPDPPVLGYIPAGTTNDFAKNLDLPRDMALAANVAVTGPSMACDMGRFNAAPFVYVAAFGAFTDVSYGTPQRFKNLFGHLAYVLEGIGRLGAIKSVPMTVTWEDGQVEGNFIFGMVSNTRSVGGFRGLPAKEVKLDDGKFEVVLVRQPENAAQLNAILTAVITQNPGPDGPVIGFHASKVKFAADKAIPWTLDGEYGGDHQTAVVENVPQALPLIYRPKA